MAGYDKSLCCKPADLYVFTLTSVVSRDRVLHSTYHGACGANSKDAIWHFGRIDLDSDKPAEKAN